MCFPSLATFKLYPEGNDDLLQNPSSLASRLYTWSLKVISLQINLLPVSQNSISTMFVESDIPEFVILENRFRKQMPLALSFTVL